MAMANETQDRPLTEVEMRVDRPSSWKTTEIWTPGPTKYTSADLGKYFSQNPPLGCSTMKPKKKSESENKSVPSPNLTTIPVRISKPITFPERKYIEPLLQNIPKEDPESVDTIKYKCPGPKCVPVPNEPVPIKDDIDVISAPLKDMEGTIADLLKEITDLLTNSDAMKRIERLIESANAELEHTRQEVLTRSKSSTPEDVKTVKYLKKSEDIKPSASLEIRKDFEPSEDLDGPQSIDSANISNLLNQTYVIHVSDCEPTKPSERKTSAIETKKKRVPMTTVEPAKEMTHPTKLTRIVKEQRMSPSKRAGNHTLPKSPHPRKCMGSTHGNQKAEHGMTKLSDRLSGTKVKDSASKLLKKQQKSISHTLPKMSPSRKVQNINIVLPAHTQNCTPPESLNSQKIPDDILNISAVPHTTPLRGTRNHRKCKESFAHSTPNKCSEMPRGRSPKKSPVDHLPLLSLNSTTVAINTYCMNDAPINYSVITHESKSYFVDEFVDQWSDPDESIKLESPPRVVAGIRKTPRKIGPLTMEKLNSLPEKNPTTDLNPTNPSPATKFLDSRVPGSSLPSTKFFTSKRKSTALEKMVQCSLNESGCNHLNVSRKIERFSEASNYNSISKISTSKPSKNYVKSLVKAWEGSNDISFLKNNSKPLYKYNTKTLNNGKNSCNIITSTHFDKISQQQRRRHRG